MYKIYRLIICSTRVAGAVAKGRWGAYSWTRCTYRSCTFCLLCIALRAYTTYACIQGDFSHLRFLFEYFPTRPTRDNHSNLCFRENYEFKLVFDHVWSVYGVFVGVFPFKYSSVYVTTMSDDILFAKCFPLWIARFDSDLNLNFTNRVLHCGIVPEESKLLSKEGGNCFRRIEF